MVALRRPAPAAKKAAAAEPAPAHKPRSLLPRMRAGRARRALQTLRPRPAPVIPLRVTPAAAVNAEADESDGTEPGSLLAGPRNVQPYMSSAAKQYMSKEQLEHFRQILQTWKRDLMEEVDRTVTAHEGRGGEFPRSQ